MIRTRLLANDSGFLPGNWLTNRRLSVFLWFGLSVFAILQDLWSHQVNNFLVFRYVYFHLLEGSNLYIPYPDQYADVNLYGPLFGLIIAPFALMPVKLGAICWVLANVSFLYWAISKLPIASAYQTALLILCSHEMMNNSSWMQSNALVCGSLLLGFSYVCRQKENRALFFIMLAAFIKLYGIAGLAFFPFSRNKVKFIGWALCWAIFCFAAPLLITHYDFLIRTYADWKTGLQLKAAKNIRLDNNNYFQDISVMGMIRRTFYPGLKDVLILVPGCLLYLSQFLYRTYYRDVRYQLYLLCSSMLFLVIFSSGAESPTYIIAVPALCLWFFMQPGNKIHLILFSIGFLFTTFSYSDLLTPWFRDHVVMRYSLKALPSFIIWMIILFQIHSRQFLSAVDIRSFAFQPL